MRLLVQRTKLASKEETRANKIIKFSGMWGVRDSSSYLLGASAPIINGSEGMCGGDLFMVWNVIRWILQLGDRHTSSCCRLFCRYSC